MDLTLDGKGHSDDWQQQLIRNNKNENNVEMKSKKNCGILKILKRFEKAVDKVRLFTLLGR